MAYGKELIIDLYGCNAEKFTRESIEQWLIELCKLIDMQREDLHFWDYEDCPKEKDEAPTHLVGTSAVGISTRKRIHGAIQFITTSDIVVHTVDLVGECYINLFTCKEFDELAALEFTKNWFGSGEYEYTSIARGRLSKCQI